MKVSKDFHVCDNPECDTMTPANLDELRGYMGNSVSLYGSFGGVSTPRGRKWFACSIDCITPAVLALIEEGSR